METDKKLRAMTLKELKERVDFAYNSHSANCEVRIVVQREGAIGSTPSVGVKSVGRGFDLDSWQFMITPVDDLFEKPYTSAKLSEVDDNILAILINTLKPSDMSTAEWFKIILDTKTLPIREGIRLQ